MSQILFTHEATFRISIFMSVLLAMVLWEIAAPKRRREIPVVIRWSNNLALIVLDTLILRLSFPILAVGLAQMAEAGGWGLFQIWDMPVWIKIIAAIILLDLVIYLQHVLFHSIPGLWRLHRMHHADLEIDVTTGLRFHPLEILISMAIKLAVVAALGPPAVAVLLFEVILNATAMFNHSNIHLHPRFDAILRWITITPDMHRIHHSSNPVETNSNYGFNLPWWDRLLGTYRHHPEKGHIDMEIGIEQFRTQRDLRVDQMLVQPLRGPASGHALDISIPAQKRRPAQKPHK